MAITYIFFMHNTLIAGLFWIRFRDLPSSEDYKSLVCVPSFFISNAQNIQVAGFSFSAESKVKADFADAKNETYFLT